MDCRSGSQSPIYRSFSDKNISLKRQFDRLNLFVGLMLSIMITTTRFSTVTVLEGLDI